MADRGRSGSPELTRRRLLRASGSAAPLLLAGCSDLEFGGDQATDTTTGSATSGPDGTGSTEDEALRRRVEDLSIREKAGQMTFLALDAQVSEDRARDVVADPGIGGILYGGANPGSFDPEAVASKLNEYQQIATTETDHGLGMVAGIDAVHGNATNEAAVVFPHNVGMGATWRPDLVRKRAAVTSRSLRAMGFQWNFSPVADVLYDPRWGRYYEGFHESPSAVSSFVSAAVEGLESSGDGTATVASSVKHFAGYSMPDAGNDRDDARIPLRDLREKVFPPFEAGVEAGAETVMANSGAVNGTPVHASEWLLRTVLRKQMGFEGVVVSDWADIRNLISEHAFLGHGQFEEGVKVVVNAGVDMYMAAESPGQFVDAVETHVQDGEIPEARVDDAVYRILRLKKRLGLLEDPTVDTNAVTDRVVTQGDFELARETAEQSMTLLTNDDVLPFDGPDTVLVTGPNADDPKSQHGGWTLGWQGLATETTPPTTTILEGIRERAPPDTSVEHVPTDRGAFSEHDAVADAAAAADVVVAVLGEGAYAETDGDVESLALPQGQRELLSVVAEAAAPTVGVLVAGRPRGGDRAFDALDAALMAYYPGSEGGPAVARTLFGDVNPGGRLPFYWPDSTGDVPVASTVRQITPGDADRFPIGHGETYTEFDLTVPAVEPSQVDPAETDTVRIAYDVENEGDRPGDHLAGALIYRNGSDPTTKPWIRVGPFERKTIAPGERQTVTLDVPLDRLAVVGGDVRGRGDWVVPAGTYLAYIEGQETQFTVTQTVSLD
ncbi:beta-glucosidase [Halomicrobium zhouii]|uniref:beta-glucosidase n=1 Tax=Halomicrobium zhouii TaxID=767519 RepID=A0A1I6LUV7_9EURY|nr:glycoside hydrolase family 3 N-terminal domain-containing protein [Halomicrobium zhouii]SFS07052.1 beta-glucosidase [Halomicrobium zhouii]